MIRIAMPLEAPLLSKMAADQPVCRPCFVVKSVFDLLLSGIIEHLSSTW